MSFRHDHREAWTLGKDDLGKTIQIAGAGWNMVGKLREVQVDGSVIAAARNRFQAKGTEYLSVMLRVGPWMATVPARSALVVETVVSEVEETPAPALVGTVLELGESGGH